LFNPTQLAGSKVRGSSRAVLGDGGFDMQNTQRAAAGRRRQPPAAPVQPADDVQAEPLARLAWRLPTPVEILLNAPA